MPARQPEQAPGRYAKWMDELKRLHRGEMALAAYPAVDGVARRLMKTNPRLSQDKADWLAGHWAAARPTAEGEQRWQILGDAAHKISNANLFRVDEALALYAAIRRPAAGGRGRPTTAWPTGGRAATPWPSTTSA